MTRKLFLTSTLAVLLASTALAQTATDTGAAGTTAASNWPVGVTTVFFTDTSMTTVRSADEIRAQWETLSESDRETVRRDCASMSADASTTGGAASGGLNDTATGTAATGTSATGTATEAITGADTDADAAGGLLEAGQVDQGDDGNIGDDDAAGTDATTTTETDATATTGTDTTATTGTDTTATTGTETAGTDDATATTGGDAATTAQTDTTAGAGADATASTGTATEATEGTDTTTLAEGSEMTTEGGAGAGQISQANLMQICSLVNTL